MPSRKPALYKNNHPALRLDLPSLKSSFYALREPYLSTEPQPVSDRPDTTESAAKMGMGPSPAARAAGASTSTSNGRPNGAGTSGSGKQPLSIEAILAQQKAEKEAASRVSSFSGKCGTMLMLHISLQPKFLSKEERAALAIERRAAEVAAEKAKVAEAAARREELERQANEARYSSGRAGPSSSRGGPPNFGSTNGRGPPGPPRQRGAASPQGVPTGPKAMRDVQRGPPGSKERPEPAAATIPTGPGRPNMSIPPPPPTTAPPPPPPSSMGPPVLPASATVPDANGHSVMPNYDEPMLASAPTPELNQRLLQARYLGKPDNKKRRTKKATDKKFIFDWNQEDDTGMSEVDPLYRVATAPSKSRDNRGQGQVSNDPYDAPSSGFGMYGGGRMAGVDPSDQAAQRAVVARQATLAPGEEVLTSQPVLASGSKKSNAAINELHWSEKPLAAMKERDWRIFREDFSIAARGGNIPHPLRSWNESTIPVQILQIIEEIGYKEPSPIQRQALPLGLNNRDIIGIAETGSGKTASFVIPMLSYIGKLPPLTDENRHLGPYALILAPTRELAQQIEVEASKFATRLGYRCVSIVGGKQMEEQALALRDGAEIIIATPGRLKDCIERHVLVLAQCTYVVMDEADRMINLGFEEVVNFLLDQLPLSNQKPDTAEAEDSEKMTSFVGGVQGVDKSGAAGLYRQTVRPRSCRRRCCADGSVCRSCSRQRCRQR